MTVVKYCKKNENAQTGSKLLIGNLAKYRSIEVSELADAGEGTFEFTIEINERVEVENQWANLIFQGSMGFGDVSGAISLPGIFNTYVKNVSIERVGPSTTIFNCAFARISYTHPNTWIFCTSLSDGDPAVGNPFKDYDDFWIVGEDQPSLDAFSNKVANLIASQVGFRRVENGIDPLPFSEIEKLKIDVRHDPVMYKPREIKINQSTQGDFGKIIQSYLDVPLCKPNSFSHEREYRFIFSPNSNGQNFSVLEQDLFLNPNFLISP